MSMDHPFPPLLAASDEQAETQMGSDLWFVPDLIRIAPELV
jgi:hypothetical protein